MKKIYLLIALALFGCGEPDKDYCLKTVKYEKSNGDIVFTQNTKVNCETCEPIVERQDATFIECID
jgi:hypothetical protein